MPSPPSDTSPAIEKILIEGYRKMSPAQKLSRVADLNNTVRILCNARIRAQHPGISDRELQLREASLRLSRDIMIRVFDWDPKSHGY